MNYKKIITADNKIKVWGLAQLYKPDSIQKSGEIIDFSYEGKLFFE